MSLTGTTRLLKALGDETRLRILNLVSHEELSVSDLMEVLNIGQSRVSTHLTLLKEVGLVVDRRVGRRSHYQTAPGPAAPLGQQVLRDAERSLEFEADLAGLEELRDRRRAESRAYFDRVAATFGDEPMPGRTWEGLARAILQLAPRGRYIDLGVGDGLLTMMLAEIAESVTAVDRSSEMLAQLRHRAETKGIHNIETIEANIEDLPLPDGSHDVAVLSQALHYVHGPAATLREARRVLAPGGRLLLIDLLAHNEDWVRENLQHEHLGFTEHDLRKLVENAGFEAPHLFRAARDPLPPNFMTLVATACVPLTARATRAQESDSLHS